MEIRTLLPILFVVYQCVLADHDTVSYAGHSVLSVLPRTEADMKVIHSLKENYKVDLWNEPRALNLSVMMRIEPKHDKHVKRTLELNHLEHFVAFENLQKVIDKERVQHSQKAPTNITQQAFNYGQYHQYSEIENFIQSLAQSHPDRVKLESIGNSYENRPIHLVRTTSGQFGTKPAIMVECGIHSREWTSIAAGAYILGKLVNDYGSDKLVTSLVDKYEFYFVPVANPDGYIYTWTGDRLWRKTRSRSQLDWMGNCRGTDANRNFDIEHCGVGTSRKPCDDIFCGDAPFSESEARALRDLMVKIGSRMKAYFTIHAFSQLWMTPYGITKQLPANYHQLQQVGTIGAQALSKRYGTVFRVGSIANVIYEAAGSSLDYAYAKLGIKMGFALELRDNGRFGFFLPQQYILPACEETHDGVLAAINAL